jgi:hypothetical protein
MRILTIFLCCTLLGSSLTAGERLNFNSQAGQDEFVYTILYDLLGKKDAGYYLEIGAGEPIHINNTYALETYRGWKGLSIDISDELSSRWYAARKNTLLSQDALQTDYSSILQEFPKDVDYLSLDVDGYYDAVLRKVMQANRTFKVITIEHDAYRYGDLYRAPEREILRAEGYHLLCGDVSNNGLAFEDWWIHPSFFKNSLFKGLTDLDCNGKDGATVMVKIKEFIAKSGRSNM